MCFSAEASIGSGLLLLAVGIATLMRMKDRRYIYFKLIPIFFGIQQLLEGIVWTTGNDPHSPLALFGKYGFLFFAFIVWPFLIPWSLLNIESDKKRRQIIMIMLAIGTTVSAKLLWEMIQYPITATISCHHVQYIVEGYGNHGLWNFIFYLIATITPFFVVRKPIMPFLGTAMIISVLIAGYCYTICFTSVWCFFAALLSFFVYTIEEK